MKTIEQITTEPLQKQTIVLDDGSTVSFVIAYVPMQYGWFFREIIYKSFKVTNIRVTNSPNILHQFKNQIPFGIACFSEENREPFLQEDFSSGTSKLYLLSLEETQDYAEYLSGQV